MDPVLKPLYAAYETVRRAREERSPLDLDVRPSAKSLLKGDGSVDRVDRAAAAGIAPADREFMILAAMSPPPKLASMRACR